MSESLVVIATGACTPIGRSAPASAAAVRAGISGFVHHPQATDSVGEPVPVAMAPWLDVALAGTDRMEALLFPAIDEAMAAMHGRVLEDGKAPVIALALGLPAPRPGVAENLQSSMKARLASRFGKRFSSAACFSSGHAAGLVGLQAAIPRLAQGSMDACLVAGVDSYLDARTLTWLESCEQLHGAGPTNNAWGFVPGEGAGAILVMRASVARQMGLRPLAFVRGAAAGQEAHVIKSDAVCIGEGLTHVLATTLATLAHGKRVTDVYCDINGEPYRSEEYGFAALRTGEHFESATDFCAPADCWGDVGAASGPLQLMLACAAMQKGYARGSNALAWCSSESGERAAALLSVDGEGG